MSRRPWKRVPRFDPGAEFVWNDQARRYNGVLHANGEPVDKRLFNRHKLRVLYEHKRILLAPPRKVEPVLPAPTAPVPPQATAPAPEPVAVPQQPPVPSTPAETVSAGDLSVMHRGGGRYAVMRGDEQMTDLLSKEDAEAAMAEMEGPGQ